MYLFGASGHCKVVIDSLRASDKDVLIEAVYDDQPKAKEIAGVPIRLTKESIFRLGQEWVITIGDNQIRKQVSERIAAVFVNAIHPSAVISPDVALGEGSVVMANVVINAEAVIGNHCIVNSGAVVEHECSIGNFVHISPNAALAGCVTVGEGTHIGIGASVIQGVQIGKWVTVGAGAVVIRDIPDYAVAVGNPAKIIKYNKP